MSITPSPNFFQIFKYTDNDNNSVKILRTNEIHKVFDGGKILLNEIPHPYNHVQINDMFEVYNTNQIDITHYFVDYITGTIFLHSSLVGQNVTIASYYSIGYLLMYGRRVYIEDLLNNFGNSDLEGVLAEIAQRVNNLITGIEQPSEIVDSRANAVKGITYTILKSRLDDMSQDIKTLQTNQGSLPILKTITKTDLVSAINENTDSLLNISENMIEQTSLDAITTAIALKSDKTYVDTHKTSNDHDGKYFTKTEINSIINNSSGADNIGVTSISGLNGTTVQSVLESVKETLDAQLNPTDTTNIVNTAYVETTGSDTTGTLGKLDKPFKTINAALDSLPSTGGVVKIGLGVFSPVAYTKWKDNVALIGSKMPSINSTNTALENGTVVQGSLYRLNKNNTIIKDLGVDSGLNVCNALYGGVAVDGLSMTCATVAHEIVSPNTGLFLQNIVTLCKDSTSAVHSCLIEGVTGAIVNNIKTYYGMHGLVLKTINSNVSNISNSYSSEDGLIIRSSPYAQCNNTNVSNIVLNNCGGIILDAFETGVNLSGINIVNVCMSNVTSAIKVVVNATLTSVNYCKLTNIDVSGNGAVGVILAGQDITVTNSSVRGFTTTLTDTGLRNYYEDFTVYPLQFNSGFSNIEGGNSTGKYHKAGHMVCLEGTITPCTKGSIVATLPVGFRPVNNMRYAVPTGINSFARLIIGSDGGISVEEGTNTVWFTIDSVSFMI